MHYLLDIIIIIRIILLKKNKINLFKNLMIIICILATRELPAVPVAPGYKSDVVCLLRWISTLIRFGSLSFYRTFVRVSSRYLDSIALAPVGVYLVTLRSVNK